MVDSIRKKLWYIIYEIYKLKVKELNSSFTHPGLIGDQNADFLVDILKSFLPEQFGFRTNMIVVGDEDNQSPETDIIIFDKSHYPKVFMEILGTKFIPKEIILACIEVKSTLDDGTLRSALKNIRNFRRAMVKQGMGSSIYGGQFGYHEPLYFIFAYKGGWKDSKTMEIGRAHV